MAKSKPPKKATKPAAKKGAVAANAAAHATPGSLAALAASINKSVGDGTIIFGEAQLPKVDFISTGIATLDAVMGGGVPRGRVIEIFGAEGSGKTTTTLEIMAACQKTYFEKLKRKGVCAFIDAEHALDPTWARNLGVNMDEVLLNQPSNGEEGFNIIEMIAKSGLVDIIVVDSVAALTPKEELEGVVTDNKIGAHARLMSKGMRRITAIVEQSNTAVVFINQIRNKIGVMYGNPETTPGGLALKFAASIRMDLRRGETIKDGDKPIGVVCKAKIIKNKVAPPYRNCVYNIFFGTVPDGADEAVYGVDKISCLFDAGVLYKVIAVSGSTYYFDGDKLASGREKSIAALQADTELAARVRAAMIAAATPEKGADLTQMDDDELDANLDDGAEDVADDEDDEEEDTGEEADEEAAGPATDPDEEEVEDLTAAAK